MADEGGRMKDESRRLSGQKPLHLSAFILYSSIRGEHFVRGEASFLRDGETILPRWRTPQVRRRSQVVRQRSAKPLFIGSIPIAASK
jgi:hypothetical protein